MSSSPQPGPARRRGLWIVAGLIAVAANVAVWLWPSERAGTPPTSPVTRETEHEALSRNVPRELGPIDDSMRTFTVRVTDTLGRPVPDAKVGVWTQPGRHPDAEALPAAKAAFLKRYTSYAPEVNWDQICWGDPTWHSPAHEFLTDAKGSAQITLPRAIVAVAAFKAGVGDSLCWTGASGQDLSLELKRRIQVTGQVLDAFGQPLAGATVHSFVNGSLRQATRARGPAPRRTDADGRFAFDLDADASLSLWALAAGDWSPKSWVMAEWDSHPDVTLRLYGRFAVQGVVLRPDGTPAPGIEVSAFNRREFPDAVTDEDGRFRFDLASPGRWAFIARSDDFISKYAEAVDLDDTSTTAEITLPLIPAASIRGRAVWDSGEPAPGCMIHVDTDGESVDWEDEGWSVVEHIHGTYNRSGADGSFTVRGLYPSMTYTVRADRVEDAAESAQCPDVPAGRTDLVLVLPRADAGFESIRGRVVDDESGAPIANFEVRRDRYGRFDETPPPWAQERERVVLSSEGSFELRGLPKQQRWLQFRAEGYPPTVIGPVLPGLPDPIEVRLGHLATLSVRVVDETGALVPSAVVHLQSDQLLPRPTSRDLPETRIVTGGRLEWADLMPTTYLIQATDEDSYSKVGRIELRSGRANDVTLQIVRDPPSGHIVVAATHGNGRPFPGVAFMTRAIGKGESGGPASLPLAAVSDETGHARIGPLAPGEYFVLAPYVVGHAPGSVTVLADQSVEVAFRAND